MAICEKCIKKSFCKLCDGSEIRGCTSLVVSSELKKNSEKLEEPTAKNDLAQERYQDLIEYFGDEKVARTILESRKEFKAWLERLRWNTKRVDELARELEQIKGTTKNNLGVDVPDNNVGNIDCISRKFMRDLGATCIAYRNDKQELIPIISIDNLPSVTPQEPILDNIRAEIEARLCDVVSDYTDGYRTAIQGNLAILDKYKAESEG